jgi:uncharacterized protein YjbJ (UPF0337 family)
LNATVRDIAGLGLTVRNIPLLVHSRPGSLRSTITASSIHRKSQALIKLSEHPGDGRLTGTVSKPARCQRGAAGMGRHQEFFIMSGTTDKISGIANEAMGKAKQGAGNVVGSDKLKAEGAAQEVKGDAQKAVGDAKNAVKDGANKAADAINKNL